MKLTLRIVLVVLPFVLSASAFGDARQVTQVVDGRSFMTDDGLRVRLFGTQAPRIYEPGGDVARDVLERYVLGREVRLETDGVLTDTEGWLLRYVFVGDTLVNALVVRKGFLAVDLPEGPVVHGDTLLVLERTAARVGKGLWPFNVYTPPSFAVPEEFLADTSGSDPWLETVSYERAEEYYGRIIRVVGTVVATYKSDKVFIMNFHQDYRRHFKAVVFPRDLAKFPPYPEDFYKKRVVRVTGLIKEYNGAAEMILNDPEQIEILQ